MEKFPRIRKIYLYLISLVGIILITIGCVKLIDLALKTYVFTKADVYYEYPMTKPISAIEKIGAITYQEPSKAEIEEFNAKQRTSQRQRTAAESLALIIVGLPLYLYHWLTIRKDAKTDKEEIIKS
jgi:hypothetical protein